MSLTYYSHCLKFLKIFSLNFYFVSTVQWNTQWAWSLSSCSSSSCYLPEMGSPSPLLCPPRMVSLTLHLHLKLLPLSAPGKGLGTILRGSGWGHIPFSCHTSSIMACVPGDQQEAASAHELLVLPSRYSVCCD